MTDKLPFFWTDKHEEILTNLVIRIANCAEERGIHLEVGVVDRELRVTAYGFDELYPETMKEVLKAKAENLISRHASALGIDEDKQVVVRCQPL